MGTKGHGTYAKLYGDVWTHPKTLRLAERLEALGVPRRWAIREAVGQLHELLIWCLGASDDGEVGHLRPEMFARVVGWTDERKAASLLNAWRASGFLDEHATNGVNGLRLHDFEECASEVLAKRRVREQARRERENRNRNGRRADAGRTPDGRRADALARASGSGSGNDTPPTPSRTSPADAVAPPKSAVVCVPATPLPDQGQRDPEPTAAKADAGSPQDERRGVRIPDDSEDGDDALIAVWNAGRARRGLPPARLSDDLATAFVAVRDATGGDPELAAAVVAAYFDDPDDFLLRCAWSPKVLPHRLDAALLDARKVVARRRAREADRARALDPAIPREPEERRSARLAAVAARPGGFLARLAGAVDTTQNSESGAVPAAE